MSDIESILGKDYGERYRNEAPLTAMTPIGETLRRVGRAAEEFVLESDVSKASRGLVRGLTLGLSDPVSALILQRTSQIGGGAPRTYQEALSEVKSQNKELKKTMPYRLGELAGNVGTAVIGTPAAAVLRASPALVPTMLRGGAAGALQGIGETEYIQDLPSNMQIGALSGLAGGVVAPTLTKAQKTYQRSVVNSYLKKRADEILTRSGIDPSKATPSDIKAARNIVANDKEFDINQYMSAPAAAQRTMEGLRETYSGLTGPVIAGALGGAGTALITGTDPTTAALVGAGGLGAFAKMQALRHLGAGLRDVTISPLVKSQDVISSATEGLTRAAAGETTRYVAEQQQEDRLRKLADEFIRKYGTPQ